MVPGFINTGGTALIMAVCGTMGIPPATTLANRIAKTAQARAPAYTRIGTEIIARATTRSAQWSADCNSAP